MSKQFVKDIQIGCKDCNNSRNNHKMKTNYLPNKNQPDALPFLIYFNNYPLHVSNRLTIHPQEDQGP